MVMTRPLRLVLGAAALLVAGAFLPAVSRWAAAHANTAVNSSRREFVEVTIERSAAAAAILAGIGVPAPALALGSAQTPGLPASGFFVQHAVLNVNDMDQNIKVTHI